MEYATISTLVRNVDEMKARLKIMFVLPSLASGGTERVVLNLVNHLPTQIFDITLVVMTNQNAAYSVYNTGVKVVFLHKSKIRYVVFRLFRVIYRTKPQIIFSSLDFNKILSLFRPFLPAYTYVVARESSIGQYTQSFLNKWLMRLFYPRLDLLVAQSVYMEQHLIQYFGINPNKIQVIHNPVDTNMIRQSQQVPIPITLPNVPIFITVGRLHPVKGHLRILKALALLEIPFLYLIIGEGTERQRIEQTVKKYQLNEKVKLLGHCTNPFQYLARATLFLQGSFTEGYPNALLEANACGIPAVAFDVPGGTSEIILKRLNGFLVPNNDIKGFGDTIEEALRTRFNKEAIQKLTSERFALTQIIKLYQEMLLEIAR